MKYLYDVWINWFEGEENGYNVCAYHEWRKTDKIDILEQVPILYITEALYNHIDNSLHDLPDEFLDTIHQRAYVRKGMSRQVLDYASIVTDGKRILAINTLGYQIPFQKSRLIPRQERQVLDLCKELKRHYFHFTEKTDEDSETLLSIDGRYMIGLTRKERQLKKLLLLALDKLSMTENRKEILYWMGEWSPKMVENVSSHTTIEEAWKMLYNEVIEGWGRNHERLCKQIIKGNTFLEQCWEMEQENSQVSR